MMRLGKVPFAPEVRARAVEMYWSSPTPSCASVAAVFGCSEETVRRWVHHAAERSPEPATITRQLTALEAIERRVASLEVNVQILRERYSPKAAADDSDEIDALF